MNYLLFVLPILVTYFTKESFGLMPYQITVTGLRGNFRTAQATCQGQGMTLLRPQNQDENNVAFTVAQTNKVGRFWIDGNNDDGQWKNSDGQYLTYFNWAPGEPNNLAGLEHCIEVGYYLNPYWNDMMCATELAILCKNNDVDPNAGTSTDTLKFELVHQTRRMTFSEALSTCKNMNMELVKVDSAWMNRYVFNYAVKNNLGWFWIDAINMTKKGPWVTSDGTPVTFTNWGLYLPSPDPFRNCAHGFWNLSDQWNDLHCDTLNAVICLRLTNKAVA